MTESEKKRARNAEAGALVLEDENAQHTICDFAGVVDG